MDRIEIKGANYFGKHDYVRGACRAIIVNDGNILLSYETKDDIWMIPGGGIEAGETDEQCVIREVGEETGLVFVPSQCVLEIDEYYEDAKYINKYFIGMIQGTTDTHLTEAEIAGGLESRWIPIEEALRIFSRHNDFIAFEEKRGLYLREYTALKAIRGE